jgi:heme oxygenase
MPYGSETMPMWMKFKSSLNLLSDQDDEAVLLKTKETFNAMEAWLLKVI